MDSQKDLCTKVELALNEVVKEAGLKNHGALARRLDVTKQAISKWKITAQVPAHRALQMELLTNGRVSWQQICPDIVADFHASTAVVLETARRA